MLHRVAPEPNIIAPLGDVCRDVMLKIALNQRDLAERDAMLAIMRKDGWLPPLEVAA